MSRLTRRIILGAFALLVLAPAAQAAAPTYEVLLDLDQSTATGCTVATARGSVHGIELSLVTTVTTTDGGAAVSSVALRACEGAALGPPVTFDSGGWPVGFGQGAQGTAAIETYVPRSALAGRANVRFAVKAAGGGGEDAMLGTSGGLLPPLPLAGNAAASIPLLSPLGLALLAALLAGLGWRERRRGRVAGALVAGVLVSATAGVVWAATVLLDGNVGDWSGVQAVATDARGNAPTDADLVAVYAQSDGTRLYFRIDADVVPDVTANAQPNVDAGANQTITLPADASLGGTASDDGLPAAPGLLALTWAKVSGPATVSFASPHDVATAATFAAPGFYVLRLTASDGALARSDDVQVKVNVAGHPDGSPELDTAAAVQAVIGADGGRLETASRGLGYRLEIPVEALQEDTTIRMTPVVALATLPYSGPLLAAVRLEPQGLAFRRKVTLTITGVPVPPPDPRGVAQAMVGFVVSPDGSSLETQFPGVAGNVATTQLAHFSDAGASDSRIHDLESRVGPALAELGPNPSPQVAQHFLAELVEWARAYGFGFCGATEVCEQIFNLGASVLQRELEAALARFETHIAQGEPYLAYDDLRVATGILENLQEISEVAAAAQVSGFEFTFDTANLADAFVEIIDLAKQQALERPRRGLLVLMLDVAANGGSLGMDSVFAHGVGALIAVLEDILADTEVLCRTDPPAGDALLDLVLSDSSETGLLASVAPYVPDLHARYTEARTACPVQVTPRPARVAMFEDLQLTGTVVGYVPDTVTWSIAGFAGGATIDSTTGRFVAGNVSGTVTVLATSVADSSRMRRVAVEVVPIEVTVAPETATIDVGQSQQFTAIVTGPTNTAVRWSASGGTIDADTGVFSSGAPGTFTVRATSLVDSGFFDTATVTVRQAALPTTLEGAMRLEMSEQVEINKYSGNYRGTSNRSIVVSALMTGITLPATGQSVALPFLVLGGAASTQTQTVSIEERVYVVNGVQCRYRLEQTVTQGGASTGDPIISDLVLRRNADGTYEFRSTVMFVAIARADVLTSYTIKGDFVPLPNDDGVVCEDRPINDQAGTSPTGVTISGSNLPEAKFELKAGLNEGTKSTTIDLSSPGEQTGERVVTLHWFLLPIGYTSATAGR